METIQPTLRNGRNVWDQINMPKNEFETRLRKIRKEMKKDGIDVLLVYGSGFNEYGNSCYLSNFINRLVTNGAIVIVPKKGEVVLMFEGSARGLPSAKATTWITDVRVSADVSKACVDYLLEKQMIPSSIGFAGLETYMPHYQLSFLYDALGTCRIIDADDLLKKMRMIKTSKEMDQIRRSSSILNHIYAFMCENAFSNLNERVLEAMLFREARLEGAEDFRMMIAEPKTDGVAFHPPGEQEISPDTTVIIHLSVEFERYWAEMTRTFFLKNHSFKDATPEFLTSLRARVTGQMIPGTKISRLYKEAMAEMQKNKFEFTKDFGLGNGIGLSPLEYPLIDKKEDSVLKEGMCLALRLMVRDKEVGAAMLGNTFVLTKKGPELLTGSGLE